MNKTCISAGEVIREMLVNDETLLSKVTKIYPVIADNAKLPYIVYRRSAMSQDPVKRGVGADTIVMQIMCCAKDYDESVALAEYVRAALDGKQSIHYCESFGVSFGKDFGNEFGGNDKENVLVVRSIVLTDCQETWQDDAYIQNLIFTIKM